MPLVMPPRITRSHCNRPVMSDSSLGLMHRATSARKSFGNPWFRVSEPFKMDGLIMDAEGGPDFFRGGVNEAHTYGNAMREVANNPKKLLGISSNDIPQNLPGWLPKFNEIATKADFNSPQTYYGASASVASRVDKAENANAHLTIPFIPVGAGSLVLSMED